MKYSKEEIKEMCLETGENFLEKAHKISKSELSVQETAMMIKALAKWKIAMNGQEEVLSDSNKY